jgi:hypothetical protein
LDVYAEERHEKVQKGSRSMKKQKIQKISKRIEINQVLFGERQLN